MTGFLQTLGGVSWTDPRVLSFLAVVTIVALVRRWTLMLLLLLLIALAEGLQYLLLHASLGADFTRGVVVGVYVFGGLLFLFLAIAHVLTKE